MEREKGTPELADGVGTRQLPNHERDSTVKSQQGRGETFAALLGRRISRRGLLKSGAVAGAIVLAAPVVRAAGVLAGDTDGTRIAGSIKFQAIPPQPAGNEQIVVAPGHGVTVLLKWGEPIHAGGPEFDPDNQSAAKQAQQVGYNCDYIGWLPLPLHSESSDRGLLWVNHEYANPELMFAGYDHAAKTQEQADIELAAHGGTIVELVRGADGRMVVDMYSPYNRRITAHTPMRVSGPAAGHPWLRTSGDPDGEWVLGMLNNCAGGVTPWGTILTCEENFQNYFGRLAQLPQSDPRWAIHDRYGIGDEESGNAYEQVYGRFSVATEPNEPFRFGWVVEVDPWEPESVPVKRTALGRFRHEGATFGHSPSGRVVFYSGDDQVFEYIYKYVSDDAWDPTKRAAAQGLLDNGTLYVARFNDDGSGEWLPLRYGDGPLTAENGFTSQGDVLVKTRLAADLLGATKMDRPEDMQQNPVNKKVYAALTNNTQRGTDERPPTDAANPRPENASGHIIEITEADDDAAAETFAWDIFILCGDPADDATYFAGYPKELVSPIAAPDNVNFDIEGNLWISTDGQPRPLGHADALYCVPTEGPQRGRLAEFLSVTNGAECASFEFTADNRNLFVAVQHPGEGGTVEEPLSTWPDGLPTPRPSVIQVWSEDGGRVGGGGPLPPRWAR